MRRRASQDQWLEAGRQAAAVARGYHAVAVIGDNGDAAAAVARGIASAIAPARRVILADLVGDVPVLRDLSTEPDPEGVEDSFDFGISLARVAHHTPVENFMLIPSASNSVEREEIFHSGRWTRLARQCRASGWLLVVVARASAPGVHALIEQLDGAITLPGAEPGKSVRVLHRVAPPAASNRWSARPAVAIAAAVVLLTIAAAVMFWRTYGNMERREDSAMPGTVVNADSSDPGLALPLQNPSDSVIAAAYAVEMMSANTRAGANLELQRTRTAYPAATLGTSTVGEARATWFRLIAGAFGDPRQADSLLRVVRSAGVIGVAGGAVIRAPFALLVDSVGTQAELNTVLAAYWERRVPAYALRQPDGRILVYVGAFITPHEAATFADELNDGGTSAQLVYRKGRAF